MPTNFRKNIAATNSKLVSKQTVEFVDWGFYVVVDTEIDALRLAYGYKDSKFGVQVAELFNGSYQVTVFNEESVDMTCDRS